LKLISSVSSFFFLFEFGWNWWNPTVFVGRKLTPQFHDWGVYQTFMFLGYSWTQGTGKIIEQLQIFREDHIDSGWVTRTTRRDVTGLMVRTGNHPLLWPKISTISVSVMPFYNSARLGYVGIGILNRSWKPIG
jgi:hypothetical protein